MAEPDMAKRDRLHDSSCAYIDKDDERHGTEVDDDSNVARAARR